jgi:hypothetical protein
MVLYTDLITPDELSGYARASFADYERAKGTLARWLPYREVDGIVARFVIGQSGLIDAAKFRAYDAPPELGKRRAVQRRSLELPALGQDIPVTEYEQLRAGGGTVTDQRALQTILETTDIVVRSVSEALEKMRGVVLRTGVATIAQSNFTNADDFGRSGSMNIAAGTLFSVVTADVIGQLQTWYDAYETLNGVPPGAILTSTRVLRLIASTNQFQLTLVGGAQRRASQADVAAVLDAEGLPPIYTYNRSVQTDGVSAKVIADDIVLMLPAPVEVNDFNGTELGGTFIGRTLTSMDPDWGIAADDQPGIVAGVYKHAKPPMGLEVISDAIGMPVLANANLAMAIDVA